LRQAHARARRNSVARWLAGSFPSIFFSGTRSTNQYEATRCFRSIRDLEEGKSPEKHNYRLDVPCISARAPSKSRPIPLLSFPSAASPSISTSPPRVPTPTSSFRTQLETGSIGRYLAINGAPLNPSSCLPARRGVAHRLSMSPPWVPMATSSSLTTWPAAPRLASPSLSPKSKSHAHPARGSSTILHIYRRVEIQATFRLNFKTERLFSISR
jgi:hypothetical protein